MYLRCDGGALGLLRGSALLVPFLLLAPLFLFLVTRVACGNLAGFVLLFIQQIIHFLPT